MLSVNDRVDDDLLRGLFAAEVVVAFTATEAPAQAPPLHAEEASHVERAVERRKRDFAFGRSVARAALASLGVPDAIIRAGRDRAPVWPDGIVGSITHCRGLAAASASRQGAIRGIGIDAEEATPLEHDVADHVCTDAEFAWIAGVAPPGIADWPKVIFSAKESVHKCVYPASGVTLGFGEVTLTFDAHGAFGARLTGAERSDVPNLARIVGRVALTSSYVLTGAVLLAPSA